MEPGLAKLPARSVHQQVAVAFTLVESADELADDCPQYPLPQHTLTEAVLEEAR